MDSTPFLQRLADELTSEARKQPLIVVMPNHRSLHVLRGQLENFGADLAQIQLLTVDVLMETLSGMQMMEAEELLVTFYHAYKSTTPSPQPFPDFSRWAATFLADSNDVDLHMGDMTALFAQVAEYRHTGEEFTKEAGPLEANFRSFWERLPDYYQALRTALEKINLGYRGLVYRKAAELCSTDAEKLTAFFAGKKTCWVGIIPGNPCEQQLLAWIGRHAALETYADTDSYYSDSPHHEAGRMFRNASQTQGAKWKTDLLGTKNYDVRIHPVGGGAGELLKVRELVGQLHESEQAETVVVLADERVLLPFTEVMGSQAENLNITAGYPLRHTIVHRFVMAWLKLHAGVGSPNGERYFYHKHVEELLQFPVLRQWLGGAWAGEEMLADIVQRNMKFVPFGWVADQMKGDIFSERVHHLLFNWPDSTVGIADRIVAVLGEWQDNAFMLRLSRIERQALPIYITRLEQLFAQFNELLDDWDVKVLRAFLHRHIGYTKVRFRGAENGAIQVMGMLETRMVDFKNVIIVGAADDTLPGNPAGTTLIPFVHRVAAGLPTRKDTEALMSYHFYRLLQRTARVHLIYNTFSTALSGGEPSRFILQLQQEWAHRNPKARITVEAEAVQVSPNQQRPLEIVKTPEVLAALRAFLSSRVSPSSLNTYNNSPLEFYYYYVLRLREQERVEEEMEASSFGSVVHDVLEAVYRPFVGEFVDEEILKSSVTRVDAMVEERFSKDFDQTTLSHGRNFLQVELAKHYVKTFIRHDLDDMCKNSPVKILELENELVGFIDMAGIRVRLMGFADRIDWRNGTVRIVDYKTGKVELNDLRARMPDIFRDTKYSKALQLAFYKWSYCKRENADNSAVESCIYSFRSARNGMMPLNVETRTEVDFIADFEENLKGLIADILNADEPFAHHPESKYLTF